MSHRIWLSLLALALALSPAAAQEPLLSPVPAQSAGRSVAPETTVWLSAEYLYWRVQGAPAPPLVTASPPGTPLAAAGVLGQPGTTVLVGNDRLNDDFRHGFRLRGGAWLDEDRIVAVQAEYFRLCDESQTSSVTGPVVSRPFFNVLAGQSQAELVSFPGIVGGTATVRAAASPLEGASVHLRANICGDEADGFRVDPQAGYRWLSYGEQLSVREDLVSQAPAAPVAAGTRLVVQDSFAARNTFHGGDFGLTGRCQAGALSVDVLGRCALGCTTQSVTVDGSRQVVAPDGSRSTAAGGLLAQQSNIGRYSRNVFSFVPEVGVRLGLRLGDNVTLFGGYTMMLWTNVARPGDQIDLGVNTNQLAPAVPGGPARPAFAFDDTSLWVQGIQAGVEVQF